VLRGQLPNSTLGKIIHCITRNVLSSRQIEIWCGLLPLFEIQSHPFQKEEVAIKIADIAKMSTPDKIIISCVHM
jgi:hypothetical protein